MNRDTTAEQKDSVLDEKITSLLDKRARFVRWTNIILIAVLVCAAMAVAVLILSGKDSQRSWISEALTTSKRNSLVTGDIVIFKQGQNNETKAGIYLGNDESVKSGLNSPENGSFVMSDAANSGAVLNALIEKVRYLQSKKSESEKIADSIATVLLNLSLIIFIGFVMKAVLVFIRYYMQLGADFENQKLAYALSKGHTGDFSHILKNLRRNSINFEKTPTLPQEKIILSLIKSMGKTGEKK
ncbi:MULTISPECIES: hypothetical protein [unclassified Providencia]|uniref:hypothetical protein n=1 Tax=unclassified Providencia TaxID=2633465 RepID=UPI00234B0A96|nr:MULTISPECIES: hypothetical protein [unclassified Providencia]WOC01231.1 hypothetical protein P3L55_07945 [Providencia sp. PROV046]